MLRLFCLSIFAVSLVAGRPLEAGSISELLAAIKETRQAHATVACSLRRESPFLTEPVRSEFVIVTQLHEEDGRFTKLLPRSSAPHLVTRLDMIRRGDEILKVNSTVRADATKTVDAEGRLHMTLISSEIGEPESSGTPRLLQQAANNLIVGTIFDIPIESYTGEDAVHLTEAAASGRSQTMVSRYGELKLEWSSSSELYPSKIFLEQSGGDLHFGKAIEAIQLNGTGGWPKGRLRSVALEIYDIRTREQGVPLLGRVAIPTAWKARCTYHCASGDRVTEFTDFEVTEIDLNPDSAGAREVPVSVPRGSPVKVEGASHLKYVWDGDWAVPAISALRPSPAELTDRFWWTILPIGVIAVTVGILLASKLLRRSTE